jgi:hypothetical protein
MNKSAPKKKVLPATPDGTSGGQPDGKARGTDHLGKMEPTAEEISRLAYRFYVEDGKPEGCAEDHWRRAETFLRHPEDHSDLNVLTVPSEPELTPALDEKAKDLDQFLPSDPHSGQDALHQRIEIAIDSRAKMKSEKDFKSALKMVKGVEQIKAASPERMTIYFDARRTNPAEIHEALSGRAADEQNFAT